ncbi:MAG: ABC transporter ATP-binding protein [Acholeplasmataceae bacterium]
MKRIRQLFSFIKGYWWMMFLIILFVVFNRFSYSYVPLFTQYLFAFLKNPDSSVIYNVNFPNFVLNYLWPNEGFQTIIKLVVLLASFQTFRFIMIFVESFLRGRIGENIQRKLRNELYDHIQSLEYQYHNNVDVGDLIQRVTSDIEMVGSFLSERVAEFFRLLATISFGTMQIYFINPSFVIVALVLIPFSGTASILYFRYVRKQFKVVEEKESKMITVIQENLAGTKIVRAFANEAHEIEKLDTINQAYSKANYKLSKASALYWGISDVISMLQYVIIIIIAIHYARLGLVMMDQLVAVLMLIGMLIWPIRGLGRLIGDFGRALVASDRLHELYQLESEFNNNGTKTPPILGHIEFRDVSFKFSDSDHHLLTNVNFTIEKGETVAVIGRTGSGKSTIVNLLSRFLEVESGQIIIDGVDIKDIEKHYLRRHMGVVLQDPFLYSRSLYDNIAISNPQVQKERVFQAATIANLDRDIQSFEKGFDTEVGERGTTLSGGQKQRVAIARILIEDKPILIFDDSLSAVDTQTDKLIREALQFKENKSTTIIITHRITTARQADKIIVLENGVVSDIGTHETLKDKPGLYKRLWDIQGSLEAEFLKMIEG